MRRTVESTTGKRNESRLAGTFRVSRLAASVRPSLAYRFTSARNPLTLPAFPVRTFFNRYQAEKISGIDFPL